MKDRYGSFVKPQEKLIQFNDSEFRRSEYRINNYPIASFIPYLVESKIKKRIASYLSDGHIHECPNHKKIANVDKNKVYGLIEKLEGLNNTELRLLFDKLQERGPDWVIDYLIGGLRKTNHLCPMEVRDGQDIRIDNFDSGFNGKQMY